MLVYGDTARVEGLHDKLAALSAALGRVAGMPAGIVRHAALVAAFIEAGELVQGIADADAETDVDAALAPPPGCRQDRCPSPAQDAAMALLMRLARAIRASWESGFARLAPSLPAPDRIRRLLDAPAAGGGVALAVPGTIVTRRAEGFAFYALYPEGYLAAAAAAGLPPSTRVIGIRSIGAPLGAMVAATLGAPPPLTVRPTGHPFRRTLSLAADLAARLPAGPAAPPVAVVDEGPGLSGSSFGAVADWLEERGVPAQRIAFFPSHDGAPGPQASERHRDRWRRAARHVVSFETLVLQAAARPEHRLEAWAADLIGPSDGPPEEISAGRWRARRYAREADWPPVHAQQERRKFLLRAAGGGGTWLLKFAGLGREGERKAERARALHAAGFTPEVAGLRHGFLVERWIGEARPLDRGGLDPGRLAEQVGRYLGFRARSFPADPGRGATPARLWEMARHNAAEALGPDAARAFDRWTDADLAELARRARPVETDNRLHAWEWLVTPAGRLIKCDALDHHAGHDLVGCQDIAWDVAGAAVELDLPGPAQARLRAVVEAEAGRPLDACLLALLAPCYLASQLGWHAMAADAAASDSGEAARLRRAAMGYASRLQRALLAAGRR